MRSRGKPPHSVFTIDRIDAPGEPTRAAVDEIITYFRENLLGPQLRPGEEQSARGAHIAGHHVRHFRPIS